MSGTDLKIQQLPPHIHVTASSEQTNLFEEILIELRDNGPQKASVIARKINTPKKEVNKWLYKIPYIVEKDEHQKWSLTDDAHIINLPSGWITSIALEQLLNRQDFDFEHIVFFISKDSRLLLDAAAILFAFVNGLASVKPQITLHFEKEIYNYWNRMDALEVLHPEISVKPEEKRDTSHLRGGNQNLVEFQSVDINSEDVDLPSNFQKFFAELASDQKDSGKVHTVVSELYSNVIQHSATTLPGFVAMQRYKSPRRGKHIQTVVSDFGGGIIQTLHDDAGDKFVDVGNLNMSDAKALAKFQLKMLERGKYTSKDNGGSGLHSIREKVKACGNADLVIRQSNYKVTLHFKEGKQVEQKIKTGLQTINGTHVCFDFYEK